MYELRMHGRGGQGAVMGAEILAKACFQPGDDEHPVGAQLLGKTPATMAKAA